MRVLAPPSPWLLRPLAAALFACTTAACARPVVTSAPDTATATPSVPVHELWTNPGPLERRSLFWGTTPPDAAPSPEVELTVTSQDETGYSGGYDAVGPDGREWDIKLGPEAQTEVVLSRILGALGYHQPAVYYLTRWRLAGQWEGENTPARFRLESDHDTDGEWDWRDNPFVDTAAFRVLLAVNFVLGNWDLKASNNRIYTADAPRPSRRYVVQDLGASLGRFGTLSVGSRNDIADFESTRLIAEVQGGDVRLNYRGQFTGVLETLHVPDLVTACERMNRLSDAQLDEAFRAAGYEAGVRRRYVAAIRARLREGLSLRQRHPAAGPDTP